MITLAEGRGLVVRHKGQEQFGLRAQTPKRRWRRISSALSIGKNISKGGMRNMALKHTSNERLIKSKERVRDRGEVFTPSHIVKDMCDLIPCDIWQNISSTFLEPACGNGNFLVEILSRKLTLCQTEEDALVACGSIFGVDIAQDNVDEAIGRCVQLVQDKFPGIDCTPIFKRNIVCGDFLHPEGIWFMEDCLWAFQTRR